jgi:ankyrin repeat protein
MQDGSTPALTASLFGHAEILALLLANKADINAAKKVE